MRKPFFIHANPACDFVQHRRFFDGRRFLPIALRRFGRGDGGVHVLRAAVRDLFDRFQCGRVTDVEHARRLRLHGFAVDVNLCRHIHF